VKSLFGISAATFCSNQQGFFDFSSRQRKGWNQVLHRL